MSNVVSFPTHKQRARLQSEPCPFAMNPHFFRRDLLGPSLKLIDKWSAASERLMLGTALTETYLDRVTQRGNGPARSFYQIEPGTYKDVLRYLNRYDNAKLKENILSACYMETFPSFEALTWNIRLSIYVARIKYWMQPEPLPDYDDISGQAAYWKKYYNGTGKGEVEDYIDAWEWAFGM